MTFEENNVNMCRLLKYGKKSYKLIWNLLQIRQAWIEINKIQAMVKSKTTDRITHGLRSSLQVHKIRALETSLLVLKSLVCFLVIVTLGKSQSHLASRSFSFLIFKSGGSSSAYYIGL